MVIGMPEALDMGVNMRFVTVGHLSTWPVGVLHRIVLAEGVRQDRYLLVPDGGQDLVMSP